MSHMIIRERRHCEITMIIPLLKPQIYFSLTLCRLYEILRQQLTLGVEIVCCALWIIVLMVSNLVLCLFRMTDEMGKKHAYHINQNVQRRSRPLLHQFSRIMFRPLCFILLAEIALERLLPPRAFARIGNGSIRRHRLVLPRILQELVHPQWLSNQHPPSSTEMWEHTHQAQCSMPTHTMSKDTDSFAIHLFEVLEYCFR